MRVANSTRNAMQGDALQAQFYFSDHSFSFTLCFFILFFGVCRSISNYLWENVIVEE
jgi:hypothetical protein